ncbi:Cytochrome c [Lemmus lemmus]
MKKRGKLKTGPNLHGLSGHKVGQGTGFSHTDENKNKDIIRGEDAWWNIWTIPGSTSLELK